MSKLTSIRFPDHVVTAIEQERGHLTFHAAVLVLLDEAIRRRRVMAEARARTGSNQQTLLDGITPKQ